MSSARPLAVCLTLIAIFAAAADAQPPAAKTGAEEPSVRRGLPDGLGRGLVMMRYRDQVSIERDIEYGNAGGEHPLLLDLMRPKQKPAQPLPLIVFIHGGGWQSGDKATGLMRIAPLVASGHYVGASINYRLTGEAVWPAQVHDCKAAIRFLRANAKKYDIDPNRIGVWGSSAGGHLVSLLGTSGDVKELEGDNGSPGVSSRVQCVVDFCGPSDFLSFTRNGRPLKDIDPEVRLLGGKLSAKMAEAKAASPVTHVTKDDPPFLIVHGTADNTVPIRQAELLAAALEKAGVEHVFIKIEGGGHNIGGDEVAKRVESFLDHHLRGQNTAVSDAPISVDSIPGGMGPRAKDSGPKGATNRAPRAVE